MKRLLLAILIISINISKLLANSFYLQTEMQSSLDTNIFSYPLVQNANAGYLEYRSEHPFFYRIDLGFGIKSNMFFSNDRVGLSLSASARFPLFARSYEPVTRENSWKEAAETGNWSYKKYDSLSAQLPFLAFSVGPAFRYIVNDIVELNLAIRVVINSYDLFKSFEIGLQADGAINLIFEENYYFTTGLCYDAHLMKFISSISEKYEENYFSLSVYPYIGFGIKLGK